MRDASNILCEAVRSVGKDRLLTRWGIVKPATMEQVEDCLRILLGL
jgi:mRNA-degrading endonuclease toxin of MazEF toxin-antitoxin module